MFEISTENVNFWIFTECLFEGHVLRFICSKSSMYVCLLGGKMLFQVKSVSYSNKHVSSCETLHFGPKRVLKKNKNPALSYIEGCVKVVPTLQLHGSKFSFVLFCFVFLVLGAIVEDN